MKQELAQRCLIKLMGWDLGRARDELAWLDLIARIKYDAYGGYFAGARFIECLLDWLQQFEANDRAVAYAFLRERLVFISASEMQHVTELFYPETVRKLLAREVATEAGVKDYLVWSRADLRAKYDALLRHALFMGLSDGARLDMFRRYNSKTIQNEQVVPTIDIDGRRWTSLRKKLIEARGDESAQFRFVFLVDDFTGSGLTFLRQAPDEPDGWDGKLLRFWTAIKERVGKELDPNFTLIVHHYIASAHAVEKMRARSVAIAEERKKRNEAWFPRVEHTFGTELPKELPISRPGCDAFMNLIDKHYNPSIMTKSMRVGGDDGRLGFNGNALPLIIEHNTPNNSVAILWAEADASATAPEMRPLFRRRQRHQ